MHFVSGVGEVVRSVGGVDRVDHLAGSARSDDRDDGYGDEGGEHQQALRDIGQGRTQETTEQRVAQGDPGDQQHAHQVGRAERGLEEHSARHHPGRYVEGEEHQDDHTRCDPQDVRMIS